MQITISSSEKRTQFALNAIKSVHFELFFVAARASLPLFTLLGVKLALEKVFFSALKSEDPAASFSRASSASSLSLCERALASHNYSARWPENPRARVTVCERSCASSCFQRIRLHRQLARGCIEVLAGFRVQFGKYVRGSCGFGHEVWNFYGRVCR